MKGYFDKEDNLKLVQKCGDGYQLEFGSEFGSYAKQINDKHLLEFCQILNNNKWLKNYDYSFFTGYGTPKPQTIYIKSFKQCVLCEIKLLDHSIFINATNVQAERIDNKVFDIILRLWRKFLCDNIEEYLQHLYNTSVLS